MNILMLSRYERLGASSRLRFYQYVPFLEEAGIHVNHAPLFSNAYVKDLQKGRRSSLEILRSYIRRVDHLLSIQRFDLLWIEKELLPWLPAWLETGIFRGTIPCVLDYDDAVFHQYDQHRNPCVRRALERKHPSLMKNAALVVAGNDYLAEFATRAGALRVEKIPTVVDLRRYPFMPKGAHATKIPCVGWIGQRATAPLLLPFKEMIQEFSTSGQAGFTAIGIDAELWDLPMTSMAWSEQTEVEGIRGFDIGIMPLHDEPFERGKCGYKLIQYMACGLPVVASPVGVNCQIVQHGVDGFLADSQDQWKTALDTLIKDPLLRERMGQAGRRKVEQQYSLQVMAPRLVELLSEYSPHNGRFEWHGSRRNN